MFIKLLSVLNELKEKSAFKVFCRCVMRDSIIIPFLLFPPRYALLRGFLLGLLSHTQSIFQSCRSLTISHTEGGGVAKRGYLDVEVTIYHTQGEIQIYKREKGKYFVSVGHHSTEFVDTALH